MRYRFFAATLAVALAAPAAAQDGHDFMNGVFASDEEVCGQVKASGAASIEEGAALTAEGLHTADFSCDFVDLKPNNGPLEGWVGMAVCEDSEINYPNVVAITPDEEGGVHANFLSDPFYSADEATSDEDAGEDETEADAGAEAAGEEAAPEEEAAEAEAEPEAEADESTEEGTDENLYVFCPGVTKQDLAKSN
jgi:hypothetical protein